MVRNCRLEAMTNCSAWVFASRNESTDGWPFNPTDNSSLHFQLQLKQLKFSFSDTEIFANVSFSLQYKSKPPKEFIFLLPC